MSGDSLIKFIIRLDSRPESWEDRICLFAAHLIHVKQIQSSTLRSYYSAIKNILAKDDYIVNDNKVCLNSLAKACRLVNDRVRTQLPIHNGLLDLLLFEVERIFDRQPYLETMYKVIFILAYYFLFRIGELTSGRHPIMAKNVHIGRNKNKMLFVLYSSKTHGYDQRPQKVKISVNTNYKVQFFCPFKISREYLALRGNYHCDEDPFFIFWDHEPVTPPHVRKVLRDSLKAIDLSPDLYGLHSFHIGHASNMINKFGYNLDQVKSAGRWWSNVVYKYIRSFSWIMCTSPWYLYNYRLCQRVGEDLDCQQRVWLSNRRPTFQAKQG